MQAAVYYGPGDLRVEETPRPAAGPDEVLVRVRAVAICGTDLRVLKGGHFRLPPGQKRILGHETAGEIAATGSEVRGLAPGQRVTLVPNIGCGVCDQCLQGFNSYCPDYEAFGFSIDGSFAEYMRVPAKAIRQGNVVPVPDNLTDDEAALVEPLACCLNGSLACRIVPGDVVVVIGAGPIGVLHVQLARLSGARRVILCETSPERLAKALLYGADNGVNPRDEDPVAAVRRLTGGKGADVAIVAASSAAAQEQAVEMLDYHGRLNLFGGLPEGVKTIALPSNIVHYRHVTITGTTGASTYQYHEALELVVARRVDVASLVSAVFPLARIHEALDFARSGEAAKVLIHP